MKALNTLIALSLLCSSSLFAQSEHKDKLDSYISDNKKAQFEYDYEKNEAESSKLRDSWIAPLNINYNYSISNPYRTKQTSQSAGVSMDQPIFQSGGIYYGIKFAQASRKYTNYSVDVAKRKLVKDAISLLMQIKQTDLKIKKQKLLIKNAEINLELKKEQYISGQLDSGFLDNAIIDKNTVTQALYDIQTTKERLVSQFNAISDMPYKSAKIPHLNMLKKDEFLAHNIVINMNDSEIEKNRYSKNVTIAKYLPKLSFTAGYSWSKTENNAYQFGPNEKDYYDYGIKASMPIDINTFVDVESSRVEYLKAKVVLEDKKRELTSLYDQVMQNIENYDKKRELSVENQKIYEKLVSDTKDLFNAGYKTEYDVELLENSYLIQGIDLKIYDIDKQLELLTLYEMYKNEI